ncbi:MAG: carboxymuconolactone decarboxylase family protein, partial [Nonomuraea sp.]|nr:carboxymuconolactone decarboxylase family protein [Nonomuraea sp.]
PGTRTGREVVALGVSLANRCPFCVAAHTTTDEDLVRLIAFGAITATERVESLLRLVRERA